MDSSDKYFDLFKQLYALKGQKIRFNTKVGLYEGYVDYLLPLNRSVSFKKVYCLPNKEFAGDLRFLFEDFISYKPIEPDEYDKYEKWDYVTRILENNSAGPKYKITDIFDDLESIESENEEDEIEEEEFVLELPSEFEGKLPKESVILDKIDSDFKSAVHSISQETVIGISFAGPRISRIGELTWISISIPQCTFLFDIQLLGNSAFNEGLRDIFKDVHIQKVIHDCRKPSDCLYHLFATKLENVFDTQVADYIVNTQRYKGKEPFKYTSSLDCCLVNHLDVPKEFIINRKGNYSYQSELNFFHVRPVTNEYRAVLLKDVIYLRLLKEKLTEFMLSPFQKAVNTYLGVLADTTGPEFLLEHHKPDEMSPAVLMHGIQTVRYEEKATAPPISLVCKFKDPQNGSLIHCDTASDKKSEVCPINTVLDKEIKKSSSSINIERIHKANLSVNEHVQKALKSSSSKNHDGDSFNANYSRRHIDDVYHKLVNNLNKPEVLNNINVKPSKGSSKLFLKKSLTNQQNDSENYCKSDQPNSVDVVSEIASGIKTVSVSHNTKTRPKIHENFLKAFDQSANSVTSSNKDIKPVSVSCNTKTQPRFHESFQKMSDKSINSVPSGNKLIFVPAGMGC